MQTRGAYVSVGDRGALPANDCSDLAALRSGVEVVTRALERDALYGALDTNLARSEKTKSAMGYMVIGTHQCGFTALNTQIVWSAYLLSVLDTLHRWDWSQRRLMF